LKNFKGRDRLKMLV